MTRAAPPGIWHLRLSGLPAALWQRHEHLLDAEERAKAARFFREADRCQYIAAHALLRQMLTAHAGPPPQSWRFIAGPHGRPELAPGQTHLPLRFSLSHTAGLVACAVTLGQDIGLDVEAVDRGADLAAIGALFAPQEAALLRGCAPSRQRAAFFELWTLKEAYLKALGLGLSVPLDAFAFALEPPALRLAAPGAGRPEDWRFHLLRPTPGHQMAVAVRAGPGEAPGFACQEVEAVSLHPLPL